MQRISQSAMLKQVFMSLHKSVSTTPAQFSHSTNSNKNVEFCLHFLHESTWNLTQLQTQHSFMKYYTLTHSEKIKYSTGFVSLG